MTNEEKAEEYFCEHCENSFEHDNGHCSNCSKWDYFIAGLAEGRKEGYEQGYEDCRHYAHDYYKPKWHDLGEDLNDLPKERGEYWSNIGLVVFDYTDSKHSWFTPFCEVCEDQEDVSDEVIAWTELPKFEEK